MGKITDDEVLIKAALAGEEEAYAVLVRRYQEVVARVVMRITRRPEWVDDVTQEVFLSAFRNLKKFRKKATFMTWMYRITVNKSLEAIRKEEARTRVIRDAAQDRELLPHSLIVQGPMNGERMVLDRERQIEVREALDRLPAPMRAVLVLRYMEEFSTPEIAQILDQPEGTIRSRLHYARQELKKIMDPFIDSAQPVRSKRRD